MDCREHVHWATWIFFAVGGCVALSCLFLLEGSSLEGRCGAGEIVQSVGCLFCTWMTWACSSAPHFVPPQPGVIPGYRARLWPNIFKKEVEDSVRITAL